MGLFRWLFSRRENDRTAALVEALVMACPKAEVDQWSPTEGEDDDADQLIMDNTFAFVLAAAIDRMGPSEKLWRIPCKLRQHWGHLDPVAIAKMDADTIATVPAIRQAPSQVGREDLAKTVRSAASLVSQKYAGNAERLFHGTTDAILDRLQQIHGVGEGIARMMISLRMLYFGLDPQPGGQLLPKLDVHVRRVFVRSGLVTTYDDRNVKQVLTGLTSRDVACIDFAAWTIGKQYCHIRRPECDRCPLDKLCAKVTVV